MRAYLRTSDGQEYPVGGEKPAIDCFRCGVCCIGYYPKVTIEEIELIASQLSINAGEFIGRYVAVTKVAYLLRQTESGCVFLARERDSAMASCEIYPIRPAPCRELVPSLWRPECREGLARFQKNSRLLLASDIYQLREQAERFYALLRQPEMRHTVTLLSD